MTLTVCCTLCALHYKPKDDSLTVHTSLLFLATLRPYQAVKLCLLNDKMTVY